MKNKYKFNKKDNIAEFLEIWFKVDYNNPSITKVFRRYYKYGVERILSSRTLSKILRINGVNPINVSHWRCFPSGRLFDRFLNIEKKMPKILKFIFTHYNYIGVKVNK